MNFLDVIAWMAGLLQLGVACYALRLNRLFGTARVGWSLFSAFALLALLHLVQSLGPLSTGTEAEIKMHVVYALISLLLLIGMAHIKALFQERLRVEREEQKVQDKLELRVKEKTADLTKANEELQGEVAKHKLTATKLEAEISERQRIAAQMEKTHKELLAASRQAGMTEFATNVLHNVGNVLNSANISASFVAEHLAQSKAGNIGRVAALMREHADNLGDFMTHDPRGQQLPGYLKQLSEHLAEEQALLLREIELVKQKVDHIKEIVTMQQNYAQVVGVAETVTVTDLVEDALRMNSDALARHDVQVVREYDPHIPEIMVEKHKVLQILVNLIRNAKYACDESGAKKDISPSACPTATTGCASL